MDDIRRAYSIDLRTKIWLLISGAMFSVSIIIFTLPLQFEIPLLIFISGIAALSESKCAAKDLNVRLLTCRLSGMRKQLHVVETELEAANNKVIS